MGEVRHVEPAVDMADEVRPVDVGRRRRNRAIDDRRQAVAVTGVGAAQVGDQRMPLPVGHRHKFRRDHPERHAMRFDKSAGVGVVAAAQFDRGLDQEAADVIADRPEGIDVDRQRLARRLAHGGAGHRGWHRRLLAPSDGGGEIRTRAFGLVAPFVSAGAGVPGPGEDFGLICPG